MKTKLLLFFTFFLTSFYLSAQINSVALVGEAVGGWPDSPGNPGPTDINQLTQVNNEYWSIQNIVVSVGDCKFRANNTWGGTGFEWAGTFPTGTGNSGGNITVTTAGVYNVVLNTATGAYSFTSSSSTIALVGEATPSGWPTGAIGEIDPNVMTTADGINYTLDDISLNASLCKFRENNSWGVNWGASAFPSGTGTQDGSNISVADTGIYDVSLNRITGAYSFTFVSTLSNPSFNDTTFKVFPNPASRNWNIIYNTDSIITSIQIVDILGKVVRNIIPNTTATSIDASSLMSGMYFAKINSDSGTETVKLIKN